QHRSVVRRPLPQAVRVGLLHPVGQRGRTALAEPARWFRRGDRAAGRRDRYGQVRPRAATARAWSAARAGRGLCTDPRSEAVNFEPMPTETAPDRVLLVAAPGGASDCAPQFLVELPRQQPKQLPLELLIVEIGVVLHRSA